MKCLECEIELVQIPKKRVKQFCSSTCRSNFWQKAKRKVAENNKPENKKRILGKRNKKPHIPEQKNPLTETDAIQESAVEKMLRENREKFSKQYKKQ